MATLSVTIQEPEDYKGGESQETREKRYARYEQVVAAMQSPEGGVEIKDRTKLLKTIPSCFVAVDAINWLAENLKFSNRTEALLFAQKLLKEGYIFPVDDYNPIVDSNDQYLRFQTPFFWPSINGNPTDYDYAVYLVKCNLRKGAKSMKQYELEAFARVQRKLHRRWEFIVQQASDQMAASSGSSAEHTIFDSQERAFWWTHRPPRKQEANLNKTVQQQEEGIGPVDPRAARAVLWAKSLVTLLADPEGYKLFRTHIEREHNEENLDFWEACRNLESAELQGEGLEKESRAIWNRFLVQNTPNEVNIPAAVRDKIDRLMKKHRYSLDMFGEAKQSIQHLMSKDIYTRFLRSPEYCDLMKQAEAAGWLEL